MKKPCILLAVMGDRSEYKSVRNWPHRMAEWMEDSGFFEVRPYGSHLIVK